MSIETRTDLTLGQLFGGASDMVRTALVPLATAFVVLIGANVVFDMIVPPDQQLRFQYVISILVVLISYVLTNALLKASGEAGANRLGGYVGLGVVSGLGIVLGLLLLIVPGLIFAARWIIAAPLLLAEDTTVGGALSHSWQATAPHWGKLLVAQLLVGTALIAAIAVATLTSVADSEIPALIGSIASNALLSAYTIGNTLLSVTAYRLLRPSSDGLAAIFA